MRNIFEYELLDSVIEFEYLAIEKVFEIII